MKKVLIGALIGVVVGILYGLFGFGITQLLFFLESKVGFLIATAIVFIPFCSALGAVCFSDWGIDEEES